MCPHKIGSILRMHLQDENMFICMLHSLFVDQQTLKWPGVNTQQVLKISFNSVYDIETMFSTTSWKHKVIIKSCVIRVLRYTWYVCTLSIQAHNFSIIHSTYMYASNRTMHTMNTLFWNKIILTLLAKYIS